MEKHPNYRAIAKSITLKSPLKEYNKWIKTPESKIKTDRDYFMLFSGMRIGRGVCGQLEYEELQKRLPMSDEEYDYYSKL